MNERIMQFRLGIFVIVAGLVLTMMIIWFEKSPTLIREESYVRVRFSEAPNVATGTPVRKRGLRVGQVTDVVFDERPGKTDGVIVTMALDRKYPIREGSVPRISRALIGDVTIDFVPADPTIKLQAATSPALAPIYEDGVISTDAADALTRLGATVVKVEDTLAEIKKAAEGISSLSGEVGNVKEFLATWKGTGEKLGDLAGKLDKVVATNEGDIAPTIRNVREASDRLNSFLDPTNRAKVEKILDQLQNAIAGIEEARPLLKDLGADVNGSPKTNFGQSLYRLNRITSDLSLLSSQLNDGTGRLNTNGTIQQLLTNAEVLKTLNKTAATVNSFFTSTKPMVDNFTRFSQRIANDPSSISRGALQR